MPSPRSPESGAPGGPDGGGGTLEPTTGLEPVTCGLRNRCSGLLPGFSIDGCLPKNPGEQIFADFALMRIWKGQSNLALDHELVLSPRVGPFKPESGQRRDK